MSKKFYITTAIDYVNSLPHLGTAYEKIGADVLARLKRMAGFDVHFQMGNDEHSLNVEKAARKKGLAPQIYCDQMRVEFEKVWKSLDIEYNGFIQTSEEHHKKGVQQLFKTLFDNGDIYKAPYKGWYCESCEAFYAEKDLADGVCPNHKTKPKWIEEENYFFRLSKYQTPLLKHLQKNPNFIQPTLRKNEILRVIEGGLQDISVSRASVNWGIVLPNDPKHVVYVWFDALINYATAVGFGSDAKKFKKWWPADCHVIGKDITRFHCVIWPAMLMAAKIPLPKTIFGHGFVYLKGEKMSKTLGNVITPMDVVSQYGPDPIRYYLMRTSGFGADGDFTWDDFIRRYNGDLANGLGNLVSRTLGMITLYCNGTLTIQKSTHKIDKALSKIWIHIAKELDAKASVWGTPRGSEINFHDYLAKVWEGITATDQYINENKPWKIDVSDPRLKTVLYHVIESLRIAVILLKSFMPRTANQIWEQCGFETALEKSTFKTAQKWGLSKKLTIKNGGNLFPRIESGDHQTGVKKMSEEKEVKIEQKEEKQIDGLLDIKEFMKLDLRIAEILQAEKVEGADRLLKLQIDIGTEKRQIVAGIAEHYNPQDLIGRKVCIVANLKPAKIRGVESNGMLLAANGGSLISILTPLSDVPAGTKVK